MALAFTWDQGALDALLRSTEGPVAADLLRRAIQVEGTAKRITSGPGTGREYTRHGIAHTASAPGEPFATDTGRLRASITHALEVDALGLVAKVGTDVIYGLYLELGSSRMSARPWLRPALSSAAI